MKMIKMTNSDKFSFVDDEDYPLLSRLNWYISDNGYAITDAPVKHIKMHKLIMGPIQRKVVIDHIDRNKLNNQKENLRAVSQSVNRRNSYRYENAKFYYFDIRERRWTIDAISLGVRTMRVDSPAIAERIIKRLKLGFPKKIAYEESITPTISISNWKNNQITYDIYKKARDNNMSIREYTLNRQKVERTSNSKVRMGDYEAVYEDLRSKPNKLSNKS